MSILTQNHYKVTIQERNKLQFEARTVCGGYWNMSSWCRALEEGTQLIPSYRSDADSALCERVQFTRVAGRTVTVEKL